MLDLHQLNIFLTAANTLNFTQAARQLHMTQPSVSQHIQLLEKQLETQLFKREGRQISLSDAGEMLVPMARSLLTQALHIEETMQSLQGRVFGHLHVGCSTTPGKYILPHLLAEFHELHPEVRVTCHVSNQQASLEQLNNGENHFAFASKPTASYHRAEFEAFTSDEIVLIAPFGHPWAGREVIEPEELYEGSYIMREEGSGTQSVVTDGLALLGVDSSKLKTLLVLGNSEAIALAVQEGIGLGFVSRIVVTKVVRNKVAIVPVRGLHLEREICFGHQKGQPSTVAQKAFWEYVQKKRQAIDPAPWLA